MALPSVFKPQEQITGSSYQYSLAHLAGLTGPGKADDFHKAKLGKFLGFRSTPKGLQVLDIFIISYHVAHLLFDISQVYTLEGSWIENSENLPP